MNPLRWLAVLTVGLLGCDGCGGCGGADPVARLNSFEPGVDRDFKSAVKQWQPAHKGDEFNVGDGLRTGPKATAELELFPDGRMKVQPGAVVRFVDSPPGDKTQRLAIEGGDVEIESGGLDIGVDTAFGLTRLKRGSRLRVAGKGNDRRLHLDVGAADIAGGDGKRSLSAGESLRLEGGVAVIEIEEAPPEPAAAEVAEVVEPSAAEPADAGLSAEELAEADEKAYGRFDEPAGTPMVQLTGGESATIHDPRTPTNIRVSLEACPGGGVVELGRSGGRFRYYRARGEGSAVVRAQPGRFRYRVRCIEDGKLQRRPVKQGRLKIVKDSARQRLPRKVPSVTIDADGRRYSVRYSNILPALTVRWRRAPTGAKQTLNWKARGKGNKRYPASAAGVQFKSGQVPEGTHTFFFEAGGTKSKTGTLDVVFDSTARAAYLSAPADGEVAAGQRVRIAGGVLPKSRVSVDGVDIPVKGGRFALDATAPSDRSAFAIRVQHKSAGTHYYLRHLKP